MRPYVAPALSSVTIGAPIQVDYLQNNFNVGLSLDVTITNTSTVQFSLDDPNADYATDYNTDAFWEDVVGLVDATVSAAVSLTVPCRAVRHNMTVFTSNSAQLTVVQGHSI